MLAVYDSIELKSHGPGQALAQLGWGFLAKRAKVTCAEKIHLLMRSDDGVYELSKDVTSIFLAQRLH